MHKQFHSNYYEAIIQIRPYNREVLNFIADQIKKRKDNIFVSRRDDFKYGTNLYISSQKFARALGKRLKNRFNGELKISRTLFKTDKNTSKTLYRGTVLFRLKEQTQKSL